MKNEISAVVFFLSKLLKNNEKLKKEEIEMFSKELGRILHEKYVNHWYPETPTKGQAYRCIRVNRFQGVDPDLQRACFNSGLVYEELGLPKEMTLWVDPCEVCCRYGEKNPSFVVASFDSRVDKMEISWKLHNDVEKATSDYHSGSSSDDEVYVTHKKSPPAPLPPIPCEVYQIPEFVSLPPPWNKMPKRKQAANYHYQQRYVPGYQQGRNKMMGHMPWIPPMMQNDRNQWTNLPLLSAGRQCLV
ncbi:protein BTG3 [Hyperolius riggenbachi]|uniref:protein BTG3 n=1 Tax=Hyperolius riggenbachi TaxID=752182 RepID=UPI0035A29AFA